MSNETEDKELEELRQQIEQKVEETKEQAAEPVVEPESPPPAPEAPQAPEPVEETPTPVTPNQSNPEKGKDDPMEWAKKKGYKSPDDMARALLQKDQEFHQSRQKAAQEQTPPPPAQNWQPRPDMGFAQQPAPGYGYTPRQADINQQVSSMYPQLDPEDVKRVMPLIVDAAEAVAFRRTAGLERELNEIRRSTSRNNELMQLMQDPAFRDSRVQKEVHSILDSDPSIFQRERTPFVYAYEKAMVSMARKQLQQGLDSGQDPTMGNKPPVTAGGGNGSAFTAPVKITEAMFDRWSPEDQKAFIQSNGRIIPKK